MADPELSPFWPPSETDFLKKARRKQPNEKPPSLAPGPSSSKCSELKRKPAPTPKGKLGKRANKYESTAPLAKEERGQPNELKQNLRDAELQLKSAQDRMTRAGGVRVG